MGTYTKDKTQLIQLGEWIQCYTDLFTKDSPEFMIDREGSLNKSLVDREIITKELRDSVMQLKNQTSPE